MNRRKVVSAAFTGVAAAGVAGFTAAPALAAASWSVKSGGAYKAQNINNNVFTDNNTKSTITCSAARVNLTGTAKTGTAVSNPLATVAASGTFGTATTPCKAGAGFNFAGHTTGTWDLNATSPISSNLVRGKITNLHETTSGLGIAAGCKFSVTGSASGTYSNAGGILSVSKAHLTIHGATGCLGHVNNNDTATYTGQLQIQNNPTTSAHPIITHV